MLVLNTNIFTNDEAYELGSGNIGVVVWVRWVGFIIQGVLEGGKLGGWEDEIKVFGGGRGVGSGYEFEREMGIYWGN